MRLPQLVEQIRYSDPRWADGTVFHGTHAGRLRAASPECGHRYQTPASWGADTVEEAEQVREAVRSLGLPLAPSLASVALKVWRRFMPERETLSVRTRHRAIWRRTHVGPMVTLPGEYPNVYHYDRRKAYLWSLNQPLPVGRSAVILGGAAALHAVRSDRWEGAAWCKVRVPVEYEWGPLPVTAELARPHRDGVTKTERVLWPSSTVVEGCWSAPELRAARDVGCEVVEVMEAVEVETARWMAPLYDYIGGLLATTSGPERVVVKALYQTGWLKLRPAEWRSWRRETRTWEQVVPVPDGDGGWRSSRQMRTSARLVEVPPRDDVEALWRQTRIKPERCILRPDVSRYVSGLNIGEMARALCGAGCGPIAAHIDSIHCQHPIKTGTGIGDFRLVQSGPARFHSPGHYQYRGGSTVGAPTFSGAADGWMQTPEGERWSCQYKDAPRWSVFDGRFDGSGWPRCTSFQAGNNESQK